jgi:hypothetical protein
MKKIYALVCGLFAMTAVNAQVTSAEMPAIGDAVFYKVINVNTFNELPAITGVGVTWDYSTIVEKIDTVQYLYVDPATTAETDSFPGAMVAEATAGINGHFFFSSDASNFYRDGFFSDELKMVYSNKLKLCALPFDFGTAFTDTYTGTGWMTGVPAPASLDDGTYSFDVQGKGTLVLPIGYFNNVMRVYYEESFSVKADIGTGTPMTIFTITEYGYEYWKAGVTKPILTFYSTNTTDFSGGNSTTKAARYQKKLTPDGTGSINESASLNCFMSPNPATDKLQLQLATGSIAQVDIYDMIGQLVLSSRPAATFVSLDITSLESGMYSVRITSDNEQVVMQKLIKK